MQINLSLSYNWPKRPYFLACSLRNQMEGEINSTAVRASLAVAVPTTATKKLQVIQWHLLLLCQPLPQTNCRSHSDTCCYCANHCHKQTPGHTMTLAVTVPTTATNKLQAIQWHLLLLCQPLPQTNCRPYSDTSRFSKTLEAAHAHWYKTAVLRRSQ